MSYQNWDSDKFKILIETVMSECCSLLDSGNTREASELGSDLVNFLEDRISGIDEEGQWILLKRCEALYSLSSNFKDANLEEKKRLFGALRALRLHFESTPDIRSVGESILSDAQIEELRKSKLIGWG